MVCTQVFAGQASRMNYLQFIKDVKQLLKDLEFSAYSDLGISNFKNVAASSADNLTERGFDQFEKLTAHVSMLDSELVQEVLGPQEVASMRFEGEVKSIAVNTGVLPPLPWEAARFQALRRRFL